MNNTFTSKELKLLWRGYIKYFWRVSFINFDNSSFWIDWYKDILDQSSLSIKTAISELPILLSKLEKSIPFDSNI